MPSKDATIELRIVRREAAGMTLSPCTWRWGRQHRE